MKVLHIKTWHICKFYSPAHILTFLLTDIHNLWILLINFFLKYWNNCYLSCVEYVLIKECKVLHVAIFSYLGKNIHMTGSNKMVNQYRWLKKTLFDFAFLWEVPRFTTLFVIFESNSTTENKGLIKTISPTPGSSA